MFVGIDPSLTNTGIVILDRGGKLEAQANIRSYPRSTWQAGILRIYDIVVAMRCILTQTPVDIVSLEGYSYGSKFQSHRLGELGFALRDLLRHYHSYVVPPTTVKKFITGSGNASKQRVANSLGRFHFDNSHLYDACALALFSLALGGYGEFTKNQFTLVKKWQDGET